MLRKIYNKLMVGIVICLIIGPTLCQAYEAAKITYTITGSVGISGVVMNGLPGNPVSDATGNYSATVEYDWSGTVTPTKEGYTFEPTHRSYKYVTAEQVNQSYTATLLTYFVSGSTGISGAEMVGLPGQPVTDKDGFYSATVPYHWTGTVTPTKSGYVFKPADRQYTNITNTHTKQNYTGSLLTYTISGIITFDGQPMEGVLVSASGAGTDTTGSDGKYSITVDYGWSGTVVPSREGYTFDLSSRKYTEVIGSKIYQNYIATILTCTISGTVTSAEEPLGGVVLNGLPGNPVTNNNGYYNVTVNYGWSSVVTPTKNGYNFDPTNKTYKPVIEHQTMDYSATLITYVVSGSVGLSGVVMEGLPGEPISDSNGYYSATVGYGWSGTVTPEKEGYTFSPVNRIYDSVIQDQVRNHTPEYLSFILSGRVTAEGSPISGATMKGLPGDPVTDKDGYYNVVVDYGWSGIVGPKKEGCIFSPAEKIYGSVIADQAQNYDVKLLTYTISGTVTCNGNPVESVSLVASNGGGTGTTNSFGRYELAVEHGWNGAVTLAKEGYTFGDGKKRYTNVIADQPNQDYNAELIKCTIKGEIILGGQPIEGVLISADNGGGSDTTNASGKYSVVVDYGWSGNVTPTKPGYIFSPPSKRYVNVTSDIIEGREQEKQAAAREAAAREAATREIATREAALRETALQQARLTKAKVDNEIAEAAVESESQLQLPPISLPEETQTFHDFTEPEQSSELLINNVFIDTELRQVLQDISSQAGITIIPDQTVTGLITCELRDVPLEKALEIVLAGTGYMVKKTPDYYLISSPNPKDAAFPASSQTKSVKLNYIPSEDAEKLLLPAFKEYVRANRDTRTIVITAPPALMARIESDLRRIDKAPSHVMLDARIVVMQNSDLLNLGIKWGWPQIQAGVFSNSAMHGGGAPAAGGKWPWGVQIGYATGATFTNALTLTLDLLEKNGEATIVSSPQILAQDGKEAEIKITTEEYYSLAPQVTGETAYYYNRAELEKIEYGTVLNIIPHIGESGDITLDLAIEVSDVVVRTDNYPVITRRTIKNTMRIQDGGTVTVAGLKKNESYRTEQNVPGLSGIPLVGGFFQDKDNKEISQQVAVFVTARLIRDSDPMYSPPEVNKLRSKQPFNQSVEESFEEALEESLSK